MTDGNVNYGNRITVYNKDHDIGGAILSIEEGKSTDMIFHVETRKMLFVLSGKIKLVIIKDGKMKAIEMNQNAALHVGPGTVYQLEGLENSVLVEFAQSPTKVYGEEPSDVFTVGLGTPAAAEVEPGANVLMNEEDQAKAVVEEKPKTRTVKKKKVTKKKTTRRKRKTT